MKSFAGYIASIFLALSVFCGCNKEQAEQVQLELDRTNMKMTVGQSQKLNAELKGAEGEFVWASSDEGLVSVNGEGLVTAIAAGSAKVVVSAAGITKECSVVVVDFTASKLELNDDFHPESETEYSYQVLKGADLQLVPKFYNADGEKVNEMAYPKFAVTLSNPSRQGETVVTVNDEGLVQAVNPGYATVRISGAGLEAHVALTVKSLELDSSEMSMFVNQSNFLEAKVYPEDLPESQRVVEWVSYSSEFVKINSKGLLTALKVTEEPVVVAAKCGDLTAECKISVTNYSIDEVVFSTLDGIKAADGTYQMLVGDNPYNLGVKFNKAGEDVTEQVKDFAVTVGYDSSDKEVATIENGIVLVHKAGTTEISVNCAGKTASFTLNVIQCVESVKIISPESNPYVIGNDIKEFTIQYAVYPENASVKTATFSSNAPEVATVDAATGVVTVHKSGNAQITVTTDGTMRPYVNQSGVTVVEPATVNLILVVSDEATKPSVEITGEGVKDGALIIKKGDKVQLAASVTPTSYSGSVIWSTTTSNILTVDANGLVTALSRGEGKVVAVAGGAVAELNVNVLGIDPTAIKIDQEFTESISVSEKHVLLSASVTAPDNGDFGGVNWYSSNEEVAVVSAEGQVSILKVGSVTITAKALSADGTRELSGVEASIDLKFTAPDVTEVVVSLPTSMIEVGESVQLGYKVIPSEAEPENVQWVIESGSELASVTSADGVLTGLGTEKVTDAITGFSSWKTVTVKVTVDGVSATAEVAIIPQQPSGIEVDLPQDGRMRIFEKWSFNPRILPSNLSGFSIGVYGMRPSGGVAMPNGAYAPFEPQTPGAYSLTFYTESNDDLVYQRQRNVVINVSPYWVESVSLPSARELSVGSTTTLLPTFTSDVAGVEPTDKTLTWTSSNESIATVDNSGRVTAKAEGVVEITATTAGPWSVPSVDQHKSATCEITVVVPSNPVYVGDYVYTDGTWSTQLDNSKTVAGVVFSLTDATASDPQLAGVYSGCTHGLAMSVTEYESSIKMSGSTYTWQDVANYASAKGGYVDLMETGLVCGYSNTAAMKAFKSENGEYSVYLDKLAEQDAVKVTGASSWYMPSMYEMSLISKNFDALNAVLNTAGKTSLEAYKSSWTGSEYQGTYWHSTWGGLNNQAPAWGLSINARAGNGNMMMTNVYPVRFVFAF